MSTTKRNTRTVRGRDAEQRRAQRHADLRAAALDLFADQGYYGTSIEEICQRAYVGTKGFYELFENKEACYLDLFRHVTANLFEQVRAGLETMAADRFALPDLIATFTRGLVSDVRVLKVAFGEAAAISTAVERERRKNRRNAAILVEAAWQRAGVELDEHRTRTVTIGLIGGLFDILADWLHEQEPDDPEDIEELTSCMIGFHDTVLRGLTG
ncbi:TetR/AcrR family transcriptional regulator [Sciscionella marina]|uniref:TetR/AcrR family transcriptional regulator n=1 Tax=Sciscionella marina TaxID=508770 RepID=UPI0003755943|nr:TetR/AcrR family transcriptional regulator [Sciscionella marina]